MMAARSALVLALLAASTVACTSTDPQPRIPARTGTPSASSSASEPASASGPVATVRAWVAAQNHAMQTGDTSQVRSLSAASCQSCDGLVDPIDEVYRRGGYFKTAGWHVDSAKQANAKSTRSTVKAAITIAGGRTLSATNAEPVRYSRERSLMVFRLSLDEGRWLVAFVGFLS